MAARQPAQTTIAAQLFNYRAARARSHMQLQLPQQRRLLPAKRRAAHVAAGAHTLLPDAPAENCSNTVQTLAAHGPCNNGRAAPRDARGASSRGTRAEAATRRLQAHLAARRVSPVLASQSGGTLLAFMNSDPRSTPMMAASAASRAVARSAAFIFCGAGASVAPLRGARRLEERPCLLYGRPARRRAAAARLQKRYQ